MTERQKRRLQLCGLIFAGIALAVGLALNAFQQNLLFFLTPSQVAAGQAPSGRLFRIGGVVASNSVSKDGLLTRFVVTDFNDEVAVEYEGVLPDLFREKQGVVIRGSMNDGERVFIAEEVLAKHDENYMPPEVKDALEAAKTLRGGGYLEIGQ